MRGDGNCYYRAVIFGLIEQIIRTNQRAAFLALYEQVAEQCSAVQSVYRSVYYKCCFELCES